MERGKSESWLKKKKLTESKVESLGGEVPQDVGGISAPEREDTFLPVCPGKRVGDAIIRPRQPALFDLGEKAD